MRCVVQRVSEASVSVNGETVGAVGPGLMVLIGVSTEDTDADLKYMTEKVPNLRIFDDENGVMNRSVLDVGGEILAVSQFTLYGDARGGRHVRTPRRSLARKGHPCGNRHLPDGYEGFPCQRRSRDHPPRQRKGILSI